MANAEPLPAAVWTPRTDRWEIVWLRQEQSVDEGSFVLTDQTQLFPGDVTLTVAEYRPDRDGTHTPLGPLGLEALGLRQKPAGTGPMP